jgi:crotonobetainyl-CoA:carnitine CoA-transferase CaiB-like acyl-CoA transferase
MSADSTTTAPPYTGTRVVDLSTGIAGGYCTKLLADAGCDVVKVEPPGGDPLRQWSASGSVGADGDRDGVLFRFLHTSKRSVVADPLTADGRTAVLELVRGAAVVVESWAPGVAEAHGLGIDDLRAVSPGVTLCSLSDFGRGGPWSDRAATEFTLQGWSGSMSARGVIERAPLQAGGRTGEWITGTAAALSVLTFLQQAVVAGRGDHLDVAALEAVMVTHTTYAALTGWLDGRRGVPGMRTIELPSIEPAKDGWVGFCTVAGQQFLDFCVLVEHFEWMESADWTSQVGRQDRRAEFRAAVAEWTSSRTVEEILQLGAELRIPVAPIGRGETIPSLDHFVATSTYVPNPRGGFLQPTVPYKLHGATTQPFGPAPQLGEHTGAIEAAAAAVAPGRAAWARASADAAKPLAGLRIADFTAWWAGPFAAHWCALMGADVIHVESAQRPDGMRTASVKPPGSEQWFEWGSVFHGANSNKRDLTLDLTRDEGRALAKQLVAECDVVIENFSPRVMEQFGLGWGELSALNPSLVMVRMPAFGLDGPWRDRVGFAQTMEQVSGMAWMTGFTDAPMIPRGPCDPLAGMHAMIGLMTALEHRRRTGEGQLVEVAMVKAALNIASEVVLEHQAYGVSLERDGNRGPVAAPQGVYRCLDDVDGLDAPDRGERWLCVAVATDEQWSALRSALGDPAWSTDPALRTLAGRRAAHDAIDAELSGWAASKHVDDAVARLWDAGVPAAPVFPGRSNDTLAQPIARGFFEKVDHPVTGPVNLWGMPVKPLTRPEWVWVQAPAPTLGQHNDEVLREVIGLGEEEVATLWDTEIVGDTWLPARKK